MKNKIELHIVSVNPEVQCMEIKQLRQFLALADTLNFSRAADSLFISQPALSKQIAALERELDVELFKRDKRSVELTSAGQAMLIDARALIIRCEKMISHVTGISEDLSPGDIFHVVIQPSIFEDNDFRKLVTDTFFDILTRLQNLRVIFSTMETEELQTALLQQEMDFGLMVNSEDKIPAELNYHVLKHDEIVLAFRSDSDYLDDIETVKKVILEREVFLPSLELGSLQKNIRILEALNIKPQIRFNPDKLSLLLNIEAGISATFLPLSRVKNLSNPNIKYLHFRNPNAIQDLVAVWRKDYVNPLIPELVGRLSNSDMASRGENNV